MDVSIMLQHKQHEERERERERNFKTLLFLTEYVEIMDNGVNFLNLYSVNTLRVGVGSQGFVGHRWESGHRWSGTLTNTVPHDISIWTTGTVTVM